jgi:uncharacterized protein (DUF983 family)
MTKNGKKRCPRCRKNKLVDDFYNAAKRGDGKSSLCKKCSRSLVDAYRARDIDEWRRKDRERKRAAKGVKNAKQE